MQVFHPRSVLVQSTVSESSLDLPIKQLREQSTHSQLIFATHSGAASKQAHVIAMLQSRAERERLAREVVISSPNQGRWPDFPASLLALSSHHLDQEWPTRKAPRSAYEGAHFQEKDGITCQAT